MRQVPNSLRTYIEGFLTEEVKDTHMHEIISSFQYLEIPKNEFLVTKGKICTHFCFIESGILQHAIEVDGEERTTYLGLKNSVTTALNSFKNQVPSRKNIRALSNCNLWGIDLENFNHLLHTNSTFYSFYYNLIENQIFLIDDYRIDLLILSPEDRYRKLLTNEPKLLREVPLHYLASFLGISSRHMSRIRKNFI